MILKIIKLQNSTVLSVKRRRTNLQNKDKEVKKLEVNVNGISTEKNPQNIS